MKIFVDVKNGLVVKKVRKLKKKGVKKEDGGGGKDEEVER